MRKRTVNPDLRAPRTAMRGSVVDEERGCRSAPRVAPTAFLDSSNVHAVLGKSRRKQLHAHG
eukprot:3313905-Prorocentrum_lima.AAC.2